MDDTTTASRFSWSYRLVPRSRYLGNMQCRLVSDCYHPKVIWWCGLGAYIGSANLTNRAWVKNIEVGTFLSHQDLVR
jgi:phosphatidylserine/phosphatidylglycerophosphate/cardiolipin synthase-like enzyme